MRHATFACLLLACVAGAAAQAAPSTATFKAIGDYLGFKPSSTDTIFVPSDAAFEKLAKTYGLGSAKEFLSPKYADLLETLGAYHIVETAPYKAATLRNNQQLTTIYGSNLTIVKGADGSVVVKGAQNSARVLKADQALGSSVVHVIDTVLLPPNVYVSLLAALKARPNLKQWAALFAADKTATEKASNPLFSGTYFAPNDAGVSKFLAASKATSVKAALGISDANLILAYHATPHAFGAAQLATIPPKEPLASLLQIGGVSEEIYHNSTKGVVSLWGPLNLQDKAKIVVKDIHIGAGVMHVINFPLLPDLSTSAKQSVVDAVASSKDLTVFAKLIDAAGIRDQLASPMFSGTVFAPTDTAFEAFAKALGFAKVEDALKNEPLVDAVLAHHLLPAAYPYERLKLYAPFTVAPFGGGNLKLARNGTGADATLTVVGAQNSAAILSDGLDAGRSVVYEVDAVVLPDSVYPTLMAALESFASSSILQNLVDATPGLAAAASDPKTAVTLFAPKNEAFLKISPYFVEEAFNAPNSTRLAGLQYHVVPGARYIPSGFTDGEVLKTELKGETLKVQLTAVTDPVTKKKQGRLVLIPTGGPPATVQRINIVCGQSVMHGIDGVLIFKSLNEVSAAAHAGRRLAQFTTGDFVTGTDVLRTNTYTRFGSDDVNQMKVQSANQAAVQQGDTTLLASAKATYTAGRLDRRTRADLAIEYTSGDIRAGETAKSAAASASGGSNLWSNAGAAMSNAPSVRASMALDTTAAAIRAVLDHPAETAKATETGARQADSTSWSQSYAGWN